MSSCDCVFIDHAPVTKGVLGGLVLSSVTFNLPLSSYRGWFDFNYSTIFDQHSVSTLLGGSFSVAKVKGINITVLVAALTLMASNYY